MIVYVLVVWSYFVGLIESLEFLYLLAPRRYFLHMSFKWVRVR